MINIDELSIQYFSSQKSQISQQSISQKKQITNNSTIQEGFYLDTQENNKTNTQQQKYLEKQQNYNNSKIVSKEIFSALEVQEIDQNNSYNSIEDNQNQQSYKILQLFNNNLTQVDVKFNQSLKAFTIKKYLKITNPLDVEDFFKEQNILSESSNVKITLPLISQGGVDGQYYFEQSAGQKDFLIVKSNFQESNLDKEMEMRYFNFLTIQFLILFDKLEKFHNLGYAHSDIKPQNIVMGYDNEPYFIDFGGAVRLKEYQNYFQQFTPFYNLKKFYIRKKDVCQYTRYQFKNEEEIILCDKIQLSLSFLFMVCLDQQDIQHFRDQTFSKIFLKYNKYPLISLIKIIINQETLFEDQLYSALKEQNQLQQNLSLEQSNNLNNNDNSSFTSSIKQIQIHHSLNKECLQFIKDIQHNYFYQKLNVRRINRQSILLILYLIEIFEDIDISSDFSISQVLPTQEFQILCNKYTNLRNHFYEKFSQGNESLQNINLLSELNATIKQYQQITLFLNFQQIKGIVTTLNNSNYLQNTILTIEMFIKYEENNIDQAFILMKQLLQFKIKQLQYSQHFLIIQMINTEVKECIFLQTKNLDLSKQDIYQRIVVNNYINLQYKFYQSEENCQEKLLADIKQINELIYFQHQNQNMTIEIFYALQQTIHYVGESYLISESNQGSSLVNQDNELQEQFTLKDQNNKFNLSQQLNYQNQSQNGSLFETNDQITQQQFVQEQQFGSIYDPLKLEQDEYQSLNQQDNSQKDQIIFNQQTDLEDQNCFSLLDKDQKISNKNYQKMIQDNLNLTQDQLDDQNPKQHKKNYIVYQHNSDILQENQSENDCFNLQDDQENYLSPLIRQLRYITSSISNKYNQGYFVIQIFEMEFQNIYFWKIIEQIQIKNNTLEFQFINCQFNQYLMQELSSYFVINSQLEVEFVQINKKQLNKYQKNSYTVNFYQSYNLKREKILKPKIKFIFVSFKVNKALIQEIQQQTNIKQNIANCQQSKEVKSFIIKGNKIKINSLNFMDCLNYFKNNSIINHFENAKKLDKSIIKTQLKLKNDISNNFSNEIIASDEMKRELQLKNSLYHLEIAESNLVCKDAQEFIDLYQQCLQRKRKIELLKLQFYGDISRIEYYDKMIKIYLNSIIDYNNSQEYKLIQLIVSLFELEYQLSLKKLNIKDQNQRQNIVIYLNDTYDYQMHNMILLLNKLAYEYTQFSLLIHVQIKQKVELLQNNNFDKYFQSLAPYIMMKSWKNNKYILIEQIQRNLM